MKKLLLIIFGLIILTSCNNSDYKPKYTDFENDWEQDNLISKVKTLSQSKAYVKDFETEETENPVIEFKKAYTDFGEISYQEHFDIFGKLEQSFKNEYNDKGYRIKSTSKNHKMLSKLVTITEFNNQGKPISGEIIFNDTLEVEAEWEYDSYGNPTTQINIENGDTTHAFIEFKYNKEGKVIEKKQIDDDENFNITKYKYDTKGNKIELIFISEFVEEMKSTYKLDKENRILKITQYNSNQIEKETLFDRFYNQTYVKFYRNGVINREMKYKYDFDKNGNWIKRKVFMKEKNKNFRFSYVEIREIEYYE